MKSANKADMMKDLEALVDEYLSSSDHEGTPTSTADFILFAFYSNQWEISVTAPEQLPEEWLTKLNDIVYGIVHQFGFDVEGSGFGAGFRDYNGTGNGKAADMIRFLDTMFATLRGAGYEVR